MSDEETFYSDKEKYKAAKRRGSYGCLVIVGFLLLLILTVVVLAIVYRS